MHAKQAEQLYTLADLSRLLKVPSDRINLLVQNGEMLGPDVLVPGGGHKGARWSASRVEQIKNDWRHPAAA